MSHNSFEDHINITNLLKTKLMSHNSFKDQFKVLLNFISFSYWSLQQEDNFISFLLFPFRLISISSILINNTRHKNPSMKNIQT